MSRTLAVVCFVLAGVVLLVAGVRYTRQVSASLSAPPSVGTTSEPVLGGKRTVKFAKTPVDVPEFAFEDLDGRQGSSASWKGKVTLVNFWATWCPPCRAEIPDLIALQKKYGDHLQIIGVSMDEAAPSEVKRFAGQYGINYPVVMASPELRRSFPGVYALPTTFMVDRDGRMVQKHVGAIQPAVIEDETLVLAGLSDATIERVEDDGQVLLANAAQATEIPGVDLTKLTPEQRTTVLKQMNTDECTCGCGLTLAQCRINDPGCEVSLPIARQLVERMAATP